MILYTQNDVIVQKSGRRVMKTEQKKCPSRGLNI